jgi:hypothetical protein
MQVLRRPADMKPQQPVLAHCRVKKVKLLLDMDA